MALQPNVGPIKTKLFGDLKAPRANSVGYSGQPSPRCSRQLVTDVPGIVLQFPYATRLLSHQCGDALR